MANFAIFSDYIPVLLAFKKAEPTERSAGSLIIDKPQ